MTARRAARSLKEIRQYELLKTRVCNLPLKIEGVLRDCILAHYNELKARKIRFRPRYYLGSDISDGWGCVNGTICVEIPFYLSNSELTELHSDYYGDVEDEAEIMKMLRHETGHAINYAYKLHARGDWKSLFGDFYKRYPRTYDTKPRSRRHVQHLDPLYAQRHPDDDWAESFAVWLTPGINWRRRYSGWAAIEKLIYVDIVMRQIANRPPLVRKIGYDVPAKKDRRMLAVLYDVEPVSALSEGEMEEYIKDLSQIFMRRVRRREYHVPAADFLRRFTEAIIDGVALWIMHSNKNSVRKIIRRLKAVCHHYGLMTARSEEAAKLAEVTALVTWYVINDIYDLG